MDSSPFFFWLNSSLGPLKVRYLRLGGTAVVCLIGLELEGGHSVNWRDLAPSDRRSVGSRMNELREAIA